MLEITDAMQQKMVYNNSLYSCEVQKKDNHKPISYITRSGQQDDRLSADMAERESGIEEQSSDTHSRVVPKHSVPKRTTCQPVIRPMDEFIRDTYRETIAKELVSTIMAGDIDVLSSLDGAKRYSSIYQQQSKEHHVQSAERFAVLEVYEDTLRFDRHMSFRRVDRNECCVSFQVYIDLVILTNGSEHCCAGSFAVDMWLDMDEKEQCTHLSFRPSCQSGDDDKGKDLDRFLIPYISNRNIEAAALEQLQKYFPEKAETDLIVDPYELARRMGLKVMCLPLYKQLNRKSLLFFCDGLIRVQKRKKNENGTYIEFDDEYYKKNVKQPGEHVKSHRTVTEGADTASSNRYETTAPLVIVPLSDLDNPDEGKYEWVKIPANTIVINMCVFHRKDRPFRVFHECFHYEWHYLFYRLQAMSSSDVSRLRRMRTNDAVKQRIKRPLTCMEWQANRGSYALAMPLPIMRPRVVSLTEQYRPESKHEGSMYENIGIAIAKQFNTRKYRARARLIQMGHVGAAGALNFKDGHYIRPFAFDHNEYSTDSAYVIGRKEMRALYKRSEEFRELFDTGDFVYVDGHVCRYSPEYVFATYDGLHMTDWANAHVNLCCLRFESVYVQNEIGEYRFGWMACDEEYVKHFYEYLKLGDNATTKERLAAKKAFLKRLPNTFPLMLGYLRQEKGYSQDKLAVESGISKKTIARWERGDAKAYSLDKVVLLCFALQLPPWLSDVLMKRARVSLDENDAFDEAVQELLDTMFNHPVDEIQNMLQSDFKRRLIGDLSIEQDEAACAM